MVLLFAYGSLQEGYPNHARIAGELGASVGRYRTLLPHALVVPREPACTNPGCGLLHRMCVMVPGFGDGVEGDVFQIDADLLGRIDELEGYDATDEAGSTYLRREIDAVPVSGTCEASGVTAYLIANAGPWMALVTSGGADVLDRFPRALADGLPKPCCRDRPGHAGPHDVISPPGLA